MEQIQCCLFSDMFWFFDYVCVKLKGYEGYRGNVGMIIMKG